MGSTVLTARRGKIIVALALTACRLTEVDDRAGEPAPGARAVVIQETLQVAGGQPRVTALAFDSATATYVERRCVGSADLAACPALETRAGTADRVALTEVFALATTPQFRGLRASYGFEPGRQPPDVHQVTLTVVAGGWRQTVVRDTRADAPAILGRLDCRLLQAQGSLILCL